MIDKKKYKKAIDFTYSLHFKQMRKGTSIPYFSHLISVSNNIIENNGNTDEAIAGLLHDAVEDQGGEKTLNLIKKKFGIKVAKIVSDCTDTDITPKPPWYERKKNYIKNLQYKSQSSLFVSIQTLASGFSTSIKSVPLKLSTKNPDLNLLKPSAS